MKSVPPPGERGGLPPGFRPNLAGGRETSGMPGFVDGVTLPDNYNPSFTYNPELMEALMPREGGQNLMYAGMVPENPSVMEPPAAPEMGGQPPNVNMDLGLLEYMRPNQRVELGPEPQAAAPAPEGAPPPSMADFDLLNYIQPSPGVELPPQQIPYQPQILEPEQGMPVPAGQPKVPPPPGAPDTQIDPELLRYLMMSGFGEQEAML
jgi:hypothetical protein